jgi:hypothetical protein
MNTINSGRFEDTNAMFEIPGHADIVIKKLLTDKEIVSVFKKIEGDM